MNKFIINGIKLDTNISKEIIENLSQNRLNLQYGYKNIIFQYNKINDNEIEFSFQRELRYEIGGDWIVDTDCSMISGCHESAFQVDLTGKETPLVPMTVPYGTHWYTGIDLFTDMYKQQLKVCLKQRTKEIRVTVSDSLLKVYIKFR